MNSSVKIKSIEETFQLVNTKFSNITQQATNSFFMEKKCGSTKCTRRMSLGNFHLLNKIESVLLK
jgi:hypothetical protein